MNEPQITPELVASHGLKPDEYERILKLIGRVPSFTELGIFSAMWNEHCSYKILAHPSARAADQGAVGDPGAGRECRRDRHRRRPGGRVQDGEPQPPELHRAVSGRDHRRRRHLARRVHHGRAARSPASMRSRSARRSIRRRAIWCRGVVAGVGGYGNSLRRADGRRRRCVSTPATTATSWSTRWRSASPIPTRSSMRRPPA